MARKSDEIRIRGLRVFAHHGVFEEETRLGQMFVVNATLYTSTRQGGLADALEQTIILGRGATRISSRELLMEMSQARSAGTAAAVPKRTGGSTVGDRIPPHVLEKLRRIGK